MIAETDQAGTASVLGVSNGAWQQIEARRVALGMPVSELAERAGVDRGRLAKVLRGEVKPRPAYLGAVDAALADIEEEAGMDAPEPPNSGLVEFDISGDFGVHVVVKGPVGDADALKAQVVDIIREIRKADTPKDR